MNNSSPPTPADKLTDLSLRLSAAVEADLAHWRLPAWLVAFIVAWIQEIGESLRELARLLREGKLNLQPATPRQGASRSAGNPAKRPQRPSRSPRQPQPAATAPAPVPLTEPEMDASPAPTAAPEARTVPLPWMPRIERPATQAPPHWPPIRKNGLSRARALARL